MRVAYITAYDPRDINGWSGLGYFIWKCLEARGIKVELIGPLRLPLHLRKWSMTKWRYYHYVQDKFYWLDGDPVNIRALSRSAGRKLKSIAPVDAVVSATHLASAFLPGDLPLMIYSDSTLRLLYQTYPVHANMAALNYRHADRIELAAGRRASALVYASEWAAKSAIEDYSADPAKVHVVPFGANLETALARTTVEQAIAGRDQHRVRLLFIGMDWERKGGLVALEVVRHLNQTGVPATLTIIGCDPKLEKEDETFVVRLGFVEKTAAGQAQIQKELFRSHFLIVPSVAECFGIVYCEASAFGVPSIARNVGGVPTAVRNGQNGQRFQPDDSPAVIAEWIRKIFSNVDDYRRLALASRAEYEAHLNWSVAGEQLERILRAAIAKKKKPAR